MNTIRWLVNVACAVTISMVFLYLSISLVVLAFIVMGDLIPGQPMYFDTLTPQLWEVLIFQVFCAAILALCFFLRAKIGLKNDLRWFVKR